MIALDEACHGSGVVVGFVLVSLVVASRCMLYALRPAGSNGQWLNQFRLWLSVLKLQ